MALKKRDGFTYLELALVLAITLIMLSIVVANFTGVFSRIKLDNCVNKMVSFLRYGQEYALTKYKSIAMDIFSEEGKLVLNLGEDISKEFKIPHNYKMESDMLQVVFEYTGSFELIDAQDPNSGGKIDGWIRITDEKNRYADIKLWAFGGDIKFESPYLKTYR